MSSLSGLGDRIAAYKSVYGLSCFVETGCGQGSGLAAARDAGFESMYSCDLNSEYVRRCRIEFPAANVEQSDSVAWLKRIMPAVPGRALVWLDAHFPEHHGTHCSGVMGFPLAEELKVLTSFGRPDVILCDDARCLADQGRWDELEEVFRVSTTLHELSEIMRESHVLDESLLRYEEGVAVFLPERLP